MQLKLGFRPFCFTHGQRVPWHCLQRKVRREPGALRRHTGSQKKGRCTSASRYPLRSFFLLFSLLQTLWKYEGSVTRGLKLGCTHWAHSVAPSMYTLKWSPVHRPLSYGCAVMPVKSSDVVCKAWATPGGKNVQTNTEMWKKCEKNTSMTFHRGY